jgi:hypothetical protein
VLAGPRCKEGGSKSMCEGAEIPTPVSSTSATFDVFSRSSKVPAHTVTGRQADVRWGSSLGWRGSVAGQGRDRCSPPAGIVWKILVGSISLFPVTKLTTTYLLCTASRLSSDGNEIRFHLCLLLSGGHKQRRNPQHQSDCYQQPVGG